MNQNPRPPATGSFNFLRWFFGAMIVVSVGLAVLGIALVVGVASYFRLSSETRALRNGLIKASGADWHQQIAFNVGRMTLGVARTGLSLVHLDKEARAALESMHGLEVGIYQLPAAAKTPDRAAMLIAADKAMLARGWERAVGVMEGHELVAIYLPEKNTNMQRLNCCVMVFDGRQMILASARTNPQPLVKCLLDRSAPHANLRWLARAQ